MSRRSQGNPLMLLLAAITAAALLCTGCSKQEDKSPAADKEKAAGDEGPFHRPVTQALAKAGLKVAEFETAAAKPYRAVECSRGEIARLDVLICRYESKAAAADGEKRIEQFFGGAVSGAVRRAETMLFAVVDRNKADPQGKTINRLLKAFDQIGQDV